jgi:Flp pilus assembly protein TadG
MDQFDGIGSGAMIRRFGRNESGASALEFALLAVPLLLIIFGTIEYGRALWTQQAMQSLAIETARCIGVASTDCANSGTYSATRTRDHLITEAAKLGVSLSSGNITLNPSTTCRGVSGFATVAISYRFVTVVPDFITALMVGPTLNASACFPNQT